MIDLSIPPLIPERYWETAPGCLFIWGSHGNYEVVPRELTSRYMDFQSMSVVFRVYADMPYSKMRKLAGKRGINEDIYYGMYHLGCALIKARAKALKPLHTTRNHTRTWVQGIDHFTFDEIDHDRISIVRDTHAYEFRKNGLKWILRSSFEEKLSPGIVLFLEHVGPLLCSIIPEPGKVIEQDHGPLFENAETAPDSVLIKSKWRSNTKPRRSSAPLQGRLFR